MKVFGNNELRRRVDEVLFYVWDPIGIDSDPCARGEYEGYVSEVLELVETNDEISPISKHLAMIISSYMGISPNKKLCDYTAKILLRNKRAIKEGLY